MNHTYTDAVLFVRELRLRLNDPKCDSVELAREELEMVFAVIDSLIDDDEEETPMTAWMLEHPWMTFFVAMTLAMGFASGFYELCKRPRSKR